MISNGQLILADADDAIVKVVIGIIVLVFWGIGALAKLGKKTNQQSQVDQAEQERLVRAHWEEVRRREAIAQALGQQQQQQGWVNQQQPAPPPLPPMPAALLREQQRQYQQPQPRSHGPVVPPMRNLPQPQRAVRPRPVAPPRVPAPARQAQRRPQPQQRKAQPRVQPQQAEVPEPVPGSSRRMVATDTPGVIESEIGQGTASASPTRRQADAAANVIRLTPQTLREQFILTEILQPPLALRDPARRER